MLLPEEIREQGYYLRSDGTGFWKDGVRPVYSLTLIPMMGIGRRDSRDVPVFEGDVVLVNDVKIGGDTMDVRGTVEYSYRLSKFYIRCKDMIVALDKIDRARITVIGHKYQDVDSEFGV